MNSALARKYNLQGLSYGSYPAVPNCTNEFGQNNWAGSAKSFFLQQSFDEIKGQGIQAHTADQVIKVSNSKYVGATVKVEKDLKSSIVYISIDGDQLGHYATRKEYLTELLETISGFARKL
ncbi:MAG: cation transport ATPase [Flavobacteriales bacterium]|jgi:cation transport ATPase